MSRHHSQNMRMQELRSDSEDDLDNSLSTTSLSPSKSDKRHYRDHSSDDEMDRIQRRLDNRNERSYNAAPQRESSVRSNVRKGPNGRPNFNESNQNRQMSKNFVPKDLGSKHPSNRRVEVDGDDVAEENSNWGKVPRRFLENDSSPGSKENAPIATAKPYVPVETPVETNWNRTNSARNNQMEDRMQDVVDEDDADDHSVESSATVEDFNAPTPPAKNNNKPSKFSQLIEQQNLKKRNTGNNNHNNGSEEGKSREQHELQHKANNNKNKLINDSPSRKFNNNVEENNAIEGSFKKYVEKTEALGTQLPRKSGRYYDEEEGNESDPANIAEEYSKDNWLLPSNKAVSSFKMHSGKSTKQYSTAKSFSFVLIAHPRGLRTEHVQCTIRRDRSSIQGKLYPSYELILEEPRKTLIVARKMNLNRTSNYHLFDMTRGQAGSKFSKKNGNYLGKLRAKNANRTEYVLLNQSSEREEVAGVLFERLSIMGQMSQGVQPRKMKILVPGVDEFGVPIPHRNIENVSESSLSEKLIILDDCEMSGTTPPSHVEMEKFAIFQSKDPVFENGNYRLNFNGRVSMPSVKNYQLVSPNNINDIICQFGKVDEDEFHLDFKAPFNAFQAFSFALCQFNL